MKRSRFNEDQSISNRKEQEAGLRVESSVRAAQHQHHPATWRALPRRSEPTIVATFSHRDFGSASAYCVGETDWQRERPAGL